MNKKGFTLVELIAVIILISIISLILFPTMLKKIKSSDTKIDEATEKVILTSANLYVNDNPNKYVHENGETYCVPVQTLIDEDYLQDNFADANKNHLIKDRYVKFSYISSFNYKIVDKSECISLIEKLIANSESTTSKYQKFISRLNNNKYIYGITEEDSSDYESNDSINWLWYGGHLWYITGFDKKNSYLTLMTSYPVTSISYDDEETNSSKNYVYSWLNDYFKDSLPKDVLNNLYNSEINHPIKTSIMGGETDEFNSYKLNRAWIGSRVISDEINNSVEKYASNNVYAVVEIRDLIYLSGEGTYNSPYRVPETTTTTTSNVKVGEYINVPRTDGETYIVRVISNNVSGIKVISTKQLGYLNRDTSSLTSVLNYINNENNYLSLDSNYSKIQKMSYYSGGYRSITRNNQDYSTVKDSVTNDYEIGLPTVSEMFSVPIYENEKNQPYYTFNTSNYLASPNGNPADYPIIMGESSNNEGKDGICGNTMCISLLYKNTLNDNIYILPVWYLNEKKTFVSGDGTIQSPYTLK